MENMKKTGKRKFSDYQQMKNKTGGGDDDLIPEPSDCEERIKNFFG